MNSFTQDSFFRDEGSADESSSGASDTAPEETGPSSAPPSSADSTARDGLIDEQNAEPEVVAEPGAIPDAVEDARDAPTAVQPCHGLVDPGQDAVDAFFGPAVLDRPRLERPPLIPRGVWIALGSIGAIVLVVLGGWLWSTRQVSIPVPTLVGIDVGVARTRLAEQGLNLTVSEQRFSAQPAQRVLAQTPAPDTKLKRGDTVSVVVSAGSEQFAMPDVVGNGVLLARGKLETKGLDVRIETQPSQLPSNTVLASNPAAGQSVHTGDIVRLTVSAPGPATALLLPFDMRGITVVLDPEPVNDALGDVPLDVARRVRSLVEASHGVVRTTRALADTSTLEAAPARAQRAANGTATVAVGLSASAVGAGGLIVFAPSPILPNASQSAKLASRLTSDIATEAGSVSSATSTTDTVLSAAKSPWARVQLGSYASREDAAKFADPNWEDTIARAIYRSLGALYGRKPAVP